MSIKLKFLSVFLSISFSCFAQKGLIIYFVTGNVNIIEENTVISASRGSIIINNKSIQLRERSSCTLIDNAGHSLQINTAGTYNSNLLQQMIGANSDDEANKKFFKFVYQDLLRRRKPVQEHVNPLVFRDIELQAQKPPSDYTIILGEKIMIRWKKPASGQGVRLLIQQAKASGQSISYIPVLDSVFKETSVLTDQAAAVLFKPGHAYRWKVELANTTQPSKRFINFLISEKADHEEIKSDFKLIQNASSSSQLKQQLKRDIFKKWLDYYLINQASL